MQQKIKSLIESSKLVFRQCQLETGAIVAANSDLNIYPKDVQNYRYVWPRDVSFILAAADLLKIKGMHEPFYNWLMERAEDFSESGLLFQNYYPNGPKRWMGFQPDQNGSVLWSIHSHCRDNLEDAKKHEPLIRKLADGILSVWNGRHFTIISQDLWEENYAYPKFEQNHTYALAACSHGLRLADEILKEEKYRKASEEMKKAIEGSFDRYFLRMNGKLKDRTIDTSMLGLAYPFPIFDAGDTRFTSTLDLIEKNNTDSNRAFRYPNDLYDGFKYSGIDGRRGSGFWPLLNFWLSICFSLRNDRKKALNYYLAAVDEAEGCFPEQIFTNEIQKSPKPLAWSHAMFILASEKLGFI
ncbi:hypothetical protein J4212_00325 [Candidatus Woesearchaeota archaeon]|nr:hypothetical protein [Candidatus Woesearchaeota archaeon]